MSITSELTKILKNKGFGFLERAIAREVDALLHEQHTLGKILIDARAWSDEWGIDPDRIWNVINKMCDAGFWRVISDLEGEVLTCKAIADSAKSIAKGRKKASMTAVKQKAAESRANDLSLSDANLAIRSMVSEVVETVPFEQRFELLLKGYAGWLPSDRYAAAGMIFKPDTAIIDKLSKQYPDIDIDLALSMMYEDLRECPHDRPNILAFPYWMPKWMKKNADRMRVNLEAQKHSEQLSTLLDDY